MPIVSRSTLFVLGAGASSCADIPLLNDFLVRSRHLLNSHRALIWKDSFDRVFDFIDSLARAEASLKIDVRNIEHIFSLIEMKRHISEDHELYRDLSRVIFETIDKSWRVRFLNGQHQPNEVYRRFSEDIVEIMKERQLNFPGIPSTKDHILSFNYDIALDYAFSFKRIPFRYQIDGKDRFNIFKIHGSMNWAKCAECGEEKDFTPGFLAEGHHYSDPPEREFLESNVATQVLAKSKCSKCNKAGSLFPIFIPPSWSKRLETGRIQKTWANLLQVIPEVFQIVIIGYSFPQTDTFFQYLLSLGLAERNHLHRVVIINPDFKNVSLQVKNIFNGLYQKRSVIFVSETFEKFMKYSGMESLQILENKAMIDHLRNNTMKVYIELEAGGI